MIKRKMESIMQALFDKLMESSPIMLREGEAYVQMIDDRGDYRYYNPGFFISNYGYIISVWSGEIRFIKPTLRPGGRKINNRERLEKLWPAYLRYVYRCWETQISKGVSPQHWYTNMDFAKRYGMNNKGHKMVWQRAVYLYFAEDGYKALDSHYEIHHRSYMDWSQPCQYSNHIGNLQAVLKKEHDRLHKIAKYIVKVTESGTVTILGQSYDVIVDGENYYVRKDKISYHYIITDGDIRRLELL